MSVRPSSPAPRPAFLRTLGAALAAIVVAASAVVGGATPASAALPTEPATVVGGHADWGVKSSFRSYITGPIAHGTITTSGGASPNPNGTFRFPAANGSLDGGTLDAAFSGAVRFVGHDGALDLTISGVHPVLTSASSGTLYVDAVSRSLESGEFTTYTGIAFATLDLTGITPAETGDTFVWTDVAATLTSVGSEAFAGFYPAGTSLDPITISVAVEETPAWTPHIQLSRSTGISPDGETVTVTGTGFDPNANISTRPPVPAGMPSGIYVVFGRFADTWQPSAGAPSSARRVLDQKWPLPAASKAAAEAAFGPNAQYVVLQPDGSFTTTLTIAPDDSISGNYGVATYAAGGAAPNASQETFTPISFATSTGVDAAASIPYFEPKGNKDETKFKVSVSNTGTQMFAVAPDDIDVTIAINGVEVAHPVTAIAPVTKNLKATKTTSFAFAWAHGASLQAGDVVMVTACVDVADDDGLSNDCTSITTPQGAVDLTTTTSLGAVTSRRTSMTFKTTAANNGAAPVLLRPDDVEYSVFVNGSPAGGTVTSKTELGKRKLVKSTKQAGYSFIWSFTSVKVGDVVKVVACVPVPGDVTPADNCSEASFVVVK